MDRTTVVAPGLATQEAIRAPPASEHESKRVEIYESTETGMVGKMGILREQTVAKNKEFVRQIDALHTRRKKLHERIAKEVEERKVQLDGIKAATEGLLKDLKAEFSVSVERTMEDLQREYLDKTSVRLDEDVEIEQEFYLKTVPETNERQTGELIRQMLRSRESFDIDNTNLRAREAVMIDRFQKHVDATDDRFEAEATDRYNTSTALREALAMWVSTSERDEAISQTSSITSLRSVKDMLGSEGDKRETADGVVLEKLQDAMQNAQSIIIENFGSV